MPDSGDRQPPSRYELRVRYSETDRMGVAYHSHYLVWCECGRTDLMRQAGYPYTGMEARGFALAVSDATLRFHASARYDDRIIVETRVTQVRSRNVEFEYLVLNGDTGARLASATTTLICINPNGKVVAIPDDIRKVLQNHVG